MIGVDILRTDRGQLSRLQSSSPQGSTSVESDDTRKYERYMKEKVDNYVRSQSRVCVYFEIE